MAFKIGGVVEMISPWSDMDDVPIINFLLMTLNKLDIPKKTWSKVERVYHMKSDIHSIRFLHTNMKF